MSRDCPASSAGAVRRTGTGKARLGGAGLVLVGLAVAISITVSRLVPAHAICVKGQTDGPVTSGRPARVKRLFPAREGVHVAALWRSGRGACADRLQRSLTPGGLARRDRGIPVRDGRAVVEPAYAAASLARERVNVDLLTLLSAHLGSAHQALTLWARRGRGSFSAASASAPRARACVLRCMLYVFVLCCVL